MYLCAWKAGFVESIWTEQIELTKRDSLLQDITTEALVIGAGMAGVLAAYFLQEHGINTVVLEADRVGSGQSKNTTAKVTSQHGLVYQKLVRKYGERKAALYAQANEEAIGCYKKVIEERKIQCDFESLPAYVYSAKKKENLLEEVKLASAFGIKAHFVEQAQLPFEHVGAVCFEGQAQFHPIKFLKEISSFLTIYEKTKVYKVKGHVAYTEHAKVWADYIVFATHYPIVNVPGFYFMRQHQERSYILALSGADRLNGMYYSEDVDGISLRDYKGFLLMGGGGHRTGEYKKNCGYGFLRQKAEQYYPGCEERYHWSAQDCMTHDDFPFIGKYSIYRPYWFVASGFKKWGMTTSILAAKLICDEICGKENPYRKLFSPQRCYLQATGKFCKDMGESVKGLGKGVYRLVGEKPRCSHMGCALEWNPQEKSWDCPCHGSRFDKEGQLIDNPAKKDLKNKG